MTPKLDVYVIILAGGSGERFWPLSTQRHPKQFLSIFGDKSLIRATYERVVQLVPSTNILVITAHDLVCESRKELPELPKGNIIGEPFRRNTAPAVALALGEVLRRGGEKAIGVILPADHLIAKPRAFLSSLKKAVRCAATTDNIVTMGVRPNFPSTGYGYIEMAGASDAKGIAHVRRFKEKPSLATANRYLKSGRYAWNAGLFVWQAGVFRRILTGVSKDLLHLAEGVESGNLAGRRLVARYSKMTAVSFDYAVMEKTRQIAVVVGDFGWDDVGSYAAIERHFQSDKWGNVVLGNGRVLDARNVSIIGRGARVSLIGVSDVVVVTADDEVMICAKSKISQIKCLQERL